MIKYIADGIVLGSLQSAQAFRNLYTYDPTTKEVLTACSLGAFYIAEGFLKAGDGMLVNEKIELIKKEFPQLAAKVNDCPYCQDYKVFIESTLGPLVNFILHLNDDHKLSRWDVAKTIRPIEEKWLRENVSIDSVPQELVPEESNELLTMVTK